MKRDMKDSGIDIIGIVPNEWNIKRLKYLVNIETGSQDTQDAIEDGEYPFFVRSPIVERIDKFVFDGEAILMAGDGVGAGKVFHYVNGKFGCHQRVYIIHSFMNILGKYLYYYIKNLFSVEIEKGSAKSTVDSVRLPMLRNFMICIPSVAEQKKVVKYLDKKCTKIDALSLDIQLQINILEDYKKSIITEAVTKGLNPGVEMKDSGIEWIKKIPITWKKVRIGYNSWIRARLGWKGLKAEEYVDEGYAFLSAFNIINNKLNWENLNYITQKRYDESPEIKLSIGDIILVKDGAGIGKCARIDALPVGGATTNGSLAVISTYGNLNYKYLYYYLQSSMFQNYIFRIMNGMGVPHLSQEELRKITVPVPSLEEQNDIADYLEKKCVEIDSSIDKKKEQLETLEQYKKSLVYEYVTGKREVSENNG